MLQNVWMEPIAHGHVKPRSDGLKVRCGGPALCAHCRLEQIYWSPENQAHLNRAETVPDHEQPAQGTQRDDGRGRRDH